MTKISIEIEIDTSKLSTCSDLRLALLWHVAQANPAPIGDYAAGNAVFHLGREIVSRWLMTIKPELYCHQESHHYWGELIKMATYQPPAEAVGPGGVRDTDAFYRGTWYPDPEKISKLAERPSRDET